MKKYICLALCLILCFVFVAACGAESGTQTTAPGATTADPNIEQETTPDTPAETETEPEPEPEEETIVPTDPMPETIPGTITMENGREIKFVLYPHIAPQSVYNFIHLAREGFYDELRFHRIISGFMIQGGCPNSIDITSDIMGRGNPGWSIFGEFSDNGFENDLLHTRGILSMARGPDYNSAGSQFFIMHADSPFLDGGYAAFGRVIEGMDVVDMIAATPNNGPNGSVDPSLMPVITSITIDSDVVVPLPDKIMR